jgi:Raf kinase inhibitor-like YbhB/YbcL family protein
MREIDCQRLRLPAHLLLPFQLILANVWCKGRPAEAGSGRRARSGGSGNLVGMALVAASMALLATLPSAASAQSKAPVSKLELTSSAFTNSGTIPRQHTCDGGDRSPALSWNDSPQGTRSFALIMDDPDAPMGTFVHWVVYNLPASARQLPEGVPSDEALSGGGLQGVNDFPRTGYGGPCPPPGRPHRYFFKLYALETTLSLKAGAPKKDVEELMKGHILAEGTLMGRYGR